MVPIVVLFIVKVVPCPLTKLVKVTIVQSFDFEDVHVDELALPLEIVEIELMEAGLALAPVEEAVGAVPMVLVIDTGPLAGLELEAAAGAALDELRPGVGSSNVTLVLRYTGSLWTVCVRVSGSPVKAVCDPSAETSADG